jgi:CBS domain-containing protein
MHILSGFQEEADIGLLRLAHVPPPIVEPDVSVLEAVHVMARDAVGAVVVVKNGELRGIFTERDLMLRVGNRRALRRPRSSAMG